MGEAVESAVRDGAVLQAGQVDIAAAKVLIGKDEVLPGDDLEDA